MGLSSSWSLEIRGSAEYCRPQVVYSLKPTTLALMVSTRTFSGVDRDAIAELDNVTEDSYKDC